MKRKQTAVEWLVDELRKHIKEHGRLDVIAISEFKKNAKEMEKEQIRYAFGQGSLFDPVFPDQFHYRSEDYYQYHYSK
jgi:hypothetical protein